MIRNRVLTGTQVACVSIFFFAYALSEVEAATRCPAGEIFRASRGVCQPKEVAASDGIFNFWPFSAKREEAEQAFVEKAKPERKKRVTPVAVSPPVAAKPAKPTQKAAALVQIEKRAPLAAKPEAALGFSSAAQSAAFVDPPVARPVQMIPVPVKSKEPSPFGSLIAFEPITR